MNTYAVKGMGHVQAELEKMAAAENADVVSIVAGLADLAVEFSRRDAQTAPACLDMAAAIVTRGGAEARRVKNPSLQTRAEPALRSTPFCKTCQTALNGSETIGRKNDFDLLRCGACGSVTVSPFPSIDDLTLFYQAYKGTVDYRAKAQKKLAHARKRLSRLKKLGSGRRFLDVGCNYGFTVKAALDLGLLPRGIDIDATAVSESGKAFGEHLFETSSVETYAEKGGRADIVYSSEVIEHVHNPDGFVRAIAAILETDGILYLTTPDAGHWRVPRNFATWRTVMPPEHITYFTRKGMTVLLERHGFRIIRIGFSLKPGMSITARKVTETCRCRFA